jgi:hypothetical protein
MPLGSMWGKMEHYGELWGIAQLHVYLSIYILVVIDSKLIVFTLVDIW